MDSFVLTDKDVCAVAASSDTDTIKNRANALAKEVCSKKSSLQKYGNMLSLYLFEDDCMYIEKKHYELKTDTRLGVFRRQALSIINTSKAAFKEKDPFVIWALTMALMVVVFWFSMIVASFFLYMAPFQRIQFILSCIVLYMVIVAINATKK